jgi:hypothetical protein
MKNMLFTLSVLANLVFLAVIIYLQTAYSNGSLRTFQLAEFTVVDGAVQEKELIKELIDVEVTSTEMIPLWESVLTFSSIKPMFKASIEGKYKLFVKGDGNLILRVECPEASLKVRDIVVSTPSLLAPSDPTSAFGLVKFSKCNGEIAELIMHVYNNGEHRFVMDLNPFAP